MLVNRGFEEASNIIERQIDIPQRNVSLLRNSDAKKAIPLAILALASFEEPSETLRAFRVREGCQVAFDALSGRHSRGRSSSQSLRRPQLSRPSRKLPFPSQVGRNRHTCPFHPQSTGQCQGFDPEECSASSLSSLP